MTGTRGSSLLQALRHPGTLVLAAFVFGALAAMLKGSDAGIRDSLGNVSAPWLLMPFVAGLTTRSLGRGAMAGAATSLAALAGFYVAEAFVLDLGGHPLLTNLSLALGAGRYYFAAGILTGPFFGALGGIPGHHRRVRAAIVIGLVLTGEPFAVFAWLFRAGMASSDTGLVVQFPALWIGEVTLGIALAAAILASGRLRWSQGTGGRILR